MNDVKKNYWRRLLCLRMEKMKLMALLLFILAMPLQGQVATHGRLTITADQMPLKELLSEVSQKSGYKVFYNAALTKDIFVSMDRTEATLNEVLDEALKSTALDYTIENGTIVIHKREMAEDAKVRESRIVSGIIYDSEGYQIGRAHV